MSMVDAPDVCGDPAVSTKMEDCFSDCKIVFTFYKKCTKLLSEYRSKLCTGILSEISL